MNVPPRPKVVVLGMMSKMPVAGVVWQTVHYLVGLERLGCEVYYVEAHARTPSMLMSREDDDGALLAARFIDAVLRRFDLAGRWAYHVLHEDGRVIGLSEVQLRGLYRSAALILNLHGGTQPRPEHYETGRLVYLETDPGQLQVELHDGARPTIDFLEPHVAFFTFAENYGHPDCGLPTSHRFSFRPTRQPVVLDLWQRQDVAAGRRFTTIANWRQDWRRVRLGGETYHWSKHLEFMKFLDLPGRSDATFELALSGFTDQDRQLLQGHGWHVRPALPLSLDQDTYRAYILGSRGEFTVAKDQNVRLRSGWFSDRSATYLSAGRPVVTQDTGFGRALPTGEGLFAYSSLEEAVSAIHTINRAYRRNAQAAGEIARDKFAHEVVLSDLLDRVGVSVTARGAIT